MEESDGMLITTLKDNIPMPKHVESLQDIRAEEVSMIALGMLESLKVEVKEIRELSGKAQKFRAMAKLNQLLHQHLEVQFQLNELMNPSLPFLRRFLLTLINKIGSSDSQVRTKKTTRKTGEEGLEEGKRKLRGWVQQEWVHPALATPKAKYNAHRLPLTLNKAILKNQVNLTSQLDNPHLQGSTSGVLSQCLNKHAQRVKQFQAAEGLTRKQNEETTMRMQQIVRVNREDWAISQHKLLKIKKKVGDQGREEQEATVPEGVSIFQQQLQVAEVQAEAKKEHERRLTIQQTQSTETQPTTITDPLELLKQQAEKKKLHYQVQIRTTINELGERKERIQAWQKEKEETQSKILSDEEKVQKLKKETVQLKKRVEKRQAILMVLEGEKDIREEVRKLEEQIRMIEEQVNEESGRIEKQIKGMQSQSKQKMEALSDLKTKLNKVEKDYEQVNQEIQQKQQLKKGVKIMKSGISRNYYHKRISDMEKRWRQTEKQTHKTRKNVDDLLEKNRLSENLTSRVETEISNHLMADSKGKTEAENKMLRDLMGKCKTAFQETMVILREVNEVKLQTQEYETKVHTLSGKNYKQNIDRIKAAMQDLKKEVAELAKMQQ